MEYTEKQFRLRQKR